MIKPGVEQVALSALGWDKLAALKVDKILLEKPRPDDSHTYSTLFDFYYLSTDFIN